MVDIAALLQGLVPRRGSCSLCGGRAASEICRDCDLDLPRLRRACRQCSLPLPPTESTCGRCLLSPPPFRRCIAAFEYAWPVDALIQRFKSGGQLWAGRLLSQQLAATLQERARTSRIELILPVPLARERLVERGFNQALQVARCLGHELGLPVDSALARATRSTRPQKVLGARERRRNLDGVFQLATKPPAQVAIVDDVVTTGATVTALSELLLLQGAKSVEVWCLARTPASLQK